ncbi:Putative major facilitator superfamily, MFS transporter superfamily [Septoria linicola]|uniref:Major facilitator superfamily, MFS transporter superfamily n=1 Tax=Septoria linicola TaxID=215465 RepID=A0A9Q9ED46_9PEZI|nr:putative major facilitator superfamily, MFS transporter superfamily [Septoria linicola]USW47386.1 Putative major facilitator superfamily, MFS transporter superfamily [Septoria linicola]
MATPANLLRHRVSGPSVANSQDASEEETEPLTAETNTRDGENHASNKAHKSNDDQTETIETISSRDGHRDKAAELLRAAGHSVIVTPDENQRILRMIDWHILPIILAIYCLQSLDKTALSYASVFGLVEDLHLVDNQYSWSAAIVYVAQLVWQPLIAYFLVKLPLAKFCAIMVFCWGATLCGMVAAKDFGGLMAARFVLGSFEASVAPTFIALVQMWYRRVEQTNRNAAWYSMLGVVNIFGSLLSYGLAKIQSDTLRPFQTIFLFCGALTVAFSVLVFIWLPDSPMQAKFLRGDDKLLAIERLRMNQMGISSGVWRWDHVKECFLDVKTWLWFSMLTAVSIPSGGITTFGPLIVKSFGFDSFTTILFNMPFGGVQLIATLGGAWAATRWKVKSPVLVVLCIPPIIGISLLLSLEHTPGNRGVLLFAYYLTSVYPAISPLIYSWSGQNTGGDTKRKATTAVLFIGASAGNIIGPNLYTTEQAPGYRSGLISNLILFILIIVLVGLGVLWIAFLNRKHAVARERMGKAAEVVDLSMASGQVLASTNGALNDTDETGVGQKAFDDMTDLANEDFIYLM